MKILALIVILMISGIKCSFLDRLRFNYMEFKKFERKYNDLLKLGQGNAPNNFDVEKHNGSFYLFSKGTATWQEGEEKCVKYGGHLTSVHNIDEDRFLVQEIKKRNMGEPWIGINDLEVLSTYVWSDRSPNNYQRWLPDEPNTAAERCGHYSRTSQVFNRTGWNDLPCTWKLRFICKVE